MMYRMTHWELEGMVMAHYRWLRGHRYGEQLFMKKVDIRGLSLREAYLKKAFFRNCLMDEMEMQCVVMPYGHLMGCSLYDANLFRIDLRESVCSDSKFIRANVESSILKATRFEGAHFTDAKLRNADLRAARLDGACLKGADLTYAIMDMAETDNAHF